MTNYWILLQSAGGPNQMITLILWGLIIVVAYFFLIRPQAKKARQQTEFIDEIEKGRKIVTTGGIHGKITKVDESTVTILVDTKTHLVIEKGAISLEMTKAAHPDG